MRRHAADCAVGSPLARPTALWPCCPPGPDCRPRAARVQAQSRPVDCPARCAAPFPVWQSPRRSRPPQRARAPARRARLRRCRARNDASWPAAAAPPCPAHCLRRIAGRRPADWRAVQRASGTPLTEAPAAGSRWRASLMNDSAQPVGKARGGAARDALGFFGQAECSRARRCGWYRHRAIALELEAGQVVDGHLGERSGIARSTRWCAERRARAPRWQAPRPRR